jgi:hypothetical protein
MAAAKRLAVIHKVPGSLETTRWWGNCYLHLKYVCIISKLGNVHTSIK